MTSKEREEAITTIKRLDHDFGDYEPNHKVFENILSAIKGNEWIPINDIEDIPKSGSYWVTKNYAFSTVVEKIRWSNVWRCWVDKDDDSVITKESAEIITAYMPYFEPEPYKAEKGGEEV